MEAYRERLEKNEQTFLEIAKELRKRGCDVYAPKNGRVNFIHVVKETSQCTFGFGEVPYRWYVSAHVDMKVHGQSSKDIKVVHGTKSTFTPDEIIKLMQPMVNSPERHREGLRYLMKIETNLFQQEWEWMVDILINEPGKDWYIQDGAKRKRVAQIYSETYKDGKVDYRLEGSKEQRTTCTLNIKFSKR